MSLAPPSMSGPDAQAALPALGRRSGDAPMTLPQLRHDIRNHLNAIKLSCALVQRQTDIRAVHESAREIERAADHINELVTRFLGDADAPNLLAAGQQVRP